MIFNNWHLACSCLQCFDTVGRHQEGHLACKNWVMRSRHGYPYGSRCKWFAYGLADATATPSSLALLKSTVVYLSGGSYPGCPGKEYIKQTSLSSVFCFEQVLDILMDILPWEIAEVVSPCLPRGLWSHIVIRVFLLLHTVCLQHPPYPVLPSCPLSRAFPYPQPGDAGGRRSAPAICQSLTSADPTIVVHFACNGM